LIAVGNRRDRSNVRHRVRGVFDFFRGNAAEQNFDARRVFARQLEVNAGERQLFHFLDHAFFAEDFELDGALEVSDRKILKIICPVCYFEAVCHDLTP
jgi:hypothetical protein